MNGSLTVCAYFACKDNAIAAETRGAEALVPVKVSLHLLFSAVVYCMRI